MYINGKKDVFFMSFLYLKNNGKLVRKIVENQTQYGFEKLKLIFKFFEWKNIEFEHEVSIYFLYFNFS